VLTAAKMEIAKQKQACDAATAREQTMKSAICERFAGRMSAADLRSAANLWVMR